MHILKLFILFGLLCLPITFAKRGGKISGRGRGQNRPGAIRKPAQQPARNRNGGNVPKNSRGTASSYSGFNSLSQYGKVGSRHRSMKIAGGLLAAYGGYHLGKKILKGAGHMFFPGYGRPYWGSRYYPGLSNPSEYMTCHYDMSEADTGADPVYYEGSDERLRSLVFECNRYYEECCPSSMDCCEKRHLQHNTRMVRRNTGLSWWHILFIFLLLGLMISCCLFFCLKYVKKRRFLQNSQPQFQNVQKTDNGNYPYAYAAPPPAYSTYPATAPGHFPKAYTDYPAKT